MGGEKREQEMTAVIDLTFTSAETFLITDEKEKEVEATVALLLKRSQKGVYAQRRNLYL